MEDKAAVHKKIILRIDTNKNTTIKNIVVSFLLNSFVRCYSHSNASLYFLIPKAAISAALTLRA